MDNYQAIYDAVRSSISNGNIGASVENVLREMNLSFYWSNALAHLQYTEEERQRPSVLFRPRVYVDGNQWCALYGDNLQDGVAGFGDSPDKAMRDFDRNWATQREATNG